MYYNKNHLKLMNGLFLEFSMWYFWTKVDCEQLKPQKVSPWTGVDSTSDCFLGRPGLFSGLEQPILFPGISEGWLHSLTLEDILSYLPWHLVSHLVSFSLTWLNCGGGPVLFNSLAFVTTSLQASLPTLLSQLFLSLEKRSLGYKHWILLS
jgi:hypothetical protein